MTYIEVLLYLQSIGEPILGQELHSIFGSKHRYLRKNGVWMEDEDSGAPVQRYGRGGPYWAWERKDLSETIQPTVQDF